MIDPFDSITGWSAGTDTANITLETSTVNQGTGSLEFDKTGTSGTTATISKKLGVPIDIFRFCSGYTLKMDHYLADYGTANVDRVAVRLVYRYDTSGNPDRYDDFHDDAAFSNAAWNTLSVDLDSPSATSGTAPTDAMRHFLVGLQVIVTVTGSSDTFTDMFLDALRLEPKTGYSPLSLLIFDGQYLPIPTLQDWAPNRNEMVKVAKAEAATQQTYLGGDETIQAMLQQVRSVHTTTSRTHSLEDSLQLFDQYAAANQGWGLAHPATELIDTTISAASAGDLSVTIASALGLDFVGFPMDLRIGPNDSRNVERVRALSRSSTTLYLDRPLRYAHEASTAIRSLGYYPSLASQSGGSMLRRGKRAEFRLSAVETA